MINIKRSYRDLDNLLTGLEQDILDLDDRELTTETELLFGCVQVVRDVIEDGLQSRVSVDQPFSDRRATQSPARPETVPYGTPALPVPNGFREKRKLLAELFAHRPGIPGQLRAAFSAPKQLSNSEVEAMVERLVRLGILRRDNTPDDDT